MSAKGKGKGKAKNIQSVALKTLEQNALLIQNNHENETSPNQPRIIKSINISNRKAQRKTFCMIPDNFKRLVTVGGTCLCMVACGSGFSFSVLIDGLQTRLGYSSSDVGLISSVGNAAIYCVSWKILVYLRPYILNWGSELFQTFVFIGPLYDWVGPRWTILLGLIIYTLGYLLMYLGYNQMVINSPGAMAFYYSLAATGSCCG
jgi:hypothetical protein